MTRTFNRDDTVAGKGGKFGGVSPYNDRDMQLAKEYMEFMDKDVDHQIDGRAAVHMLAEFAGFRGVDLREEIAALSIESTGVAMDFKWRARAEKAELKLHRALTLLVQGQTIKAEDLEETPDLGLVKFGSQRVFKDV